MISITTLSVKLLLSEDINGEEEIVTMLIKKFTLEEKIGEVLIKKLIITVMESTD
jgi:hypothetical protein